VFCFKEEADAKKSNRSADRFLRFGSWNFVLAFGVVGACYFRRATFSLEVMA
jgi:hypothetical protein